MNTFGGKLEVGQPAMVIKTRLPENSWLIGSIVTVERFVQTGENLKSIFIMPDDVALGLMQHQSCVLVSGSKKTGKTSDGNYSMKEGHCLFNAGNLMPLPPLDEKEIQKEKELEFS